MENQLDSLDEFALQGQANLLAKVAKSIKAGAVEGRPRAYLARDLAELRKIEKQIAALLDGTAYWPL